MSFAEPRSRRSPPDLVIFDCDGVLVDSEPIANRVLAEAVSALGWALTTADCLRTFKGQHFDHVIATVEARLGRPVGEDWLPDLRHRTAEAFRRELQAVDGIHDLLAGLTAAGIATCVASQGPPEKMAVSLDVTGLLPFFESRIFSAYEVARGKPHPDLFLHAAESLATLPERCAVVEDSPLGVQGAIAAGMSIFGFSPDGDGDALAAAGAQVFSDMADLPLLLGLD